MSRSAKSGVDSPVVKGTTAAAVPQISSPFNLDNIQGDILDGLIKKFETFLFFQISDPALFKVRMHGVLPIITTARQVKNDAAAIAAHKVQQVPGLLALVGTNVAFSQTGLNALGINDDLGDSFFSEGQFADASKPNSQGGLSDPIDAWDAKFKTPNHGVFLITGDSAATVKQRVFAVSLVLTGSIKIIQQIDGSVRTGAVAGFEHFGWKDGISNPPLIGFHKPNPGDEPTQPGIILFGATGDSGAARRPTWTKDGSFLVFRKLHQNVPEFNQFLAANPLKVPGLTPSQGSELLGARMVGRWKSGASISRNPKADNLKEADDNSINNNFNFTDDLSGAKCPFSSHIRKMNPRNGSFPGIGNVQPSRIMRRGIPYGPEVTPAEAAAQKTLNDRGLLFACYQTNIGRGFHFVQNAWANDTNFPNKSLGVDPLIGQSDGGAVRDAKQLDPKDLAINTKFPPALWVTPLGGEYFISPSLSALNTFFPDPSAPASSAGPTKIASIPHTAFQGPVVGGSNTAQAPVQAPATDERDADEEE